MLHVLIAATVAVFKSPGRPADESPLLEPIPALLELAAPKLELGPALLELAPLEEGAPDYDQQLAVLLERPKERLRLHPLRQARVDGDVVYTGDDAPWPQRVLREGRHALPVPLRDRAGCLYHDHLQPESIQGRDLNP